MAHPFPPAPKAIRAVQPPDRAELLEIAAATGLFRPGEILDISAKLDTFLSSESPSDRWIIATDGDAVVGLAYCAPERMTSGTWNLYLLAIHPDYQGRGYGTRLVRYVETNLQNGGARLLLIETSGVPAFAGQRRFYANLGYHQEATIRAFYDAGDDKVVYRKALRAADSVPESGEIPVGADRPVGGSTSPEDG